MAVLARLVSLAVLAAAVATMACGSPSIADGTITCGPAGSCPDGFHCAANQLCYRAPPSDAPAMPDADAAIDGPLMIDAPPISLDCTSYCSAITARCTGVNQQYGSLATCMSSCQYFSVGATTDTTGNTLGCRVSHVELAQAARSTHCVHAGPSGGGVCGQPCEGFCAIAVAACPGVHTVGQCPTDCTQIPATPPYSTAIQSGDSVSCRLYYATAAAADPTTYCPDTSASSSLMCQ
jgi:hypothetical protein